MIDPGKLAAKAAEYCHCAETGKDHCFYCDVQKMIIKLVKERDAARKQCEKLDEIRKILDRAVRAHHPSVPDCPGKPKHNWPADYLDLRRTRTNQRNDNRSR